MNLILAGKKKEAPDVTTFRFHSRQLKSWKPGQYLHYVLQHEHPDNRQMERYFTIASAPYERVVQITTRFARGSSTFKKALQRLKVGESIQADTVEGDFTMSDPRRQHVFISGGIGITPYRAILRDLDHAGPPINVLLLYANHDDKFVFKKEFELLARKHPGFGIRYFTGRFRLDEAAIRAAVGDLKKPVFWISGPEPMVESFEKLLKRMGVPKSQLKTDFFPGYRWP